MHAPLHDLLAAAAALAGKTTDAAAAPPSLDCRPPQVALERLKFFSKPRLALDAVGGESAARLADALGEGGQVRGVCHWRGGTWNARVLSAASISCQAGLWLHSSCSVVRA